MPCIYKITNCVNGKCYVGQTKRKLSIRWNQHLNSGKNTKSNQAIHKAMRKYGVECFLIEVLQECKASELNELEVYWIAKLDTYKHGYNETYGGDAKTPAQIAKIRTSNLKNVSKLYKKIKQYSLDGELIKIHNSIRQAATLTCIDRALIAKCCNGKNTTAEGFLWCREGDESKIKPVPFGKVAPNRSKVVIGIDDKGNTLTFQSAADAARYVGGEINYLRKRCNGSIKDNFYKGYYWKYKD